MASLWENVVGGVSAMFGFQIPRDPNKEKNQPSFAPKPEDDGAVQLQATGGFYGTYVDLEGVVRGEAELINKYRDMMLHPEVDSAVEDIICEAIVTEEGEPTVQIVLDDIKELPPALKQVIEQEFDEILKLFEFNTKSYEVFKRWYVDGRIYYQVIIDTTRPEEGIKELRFLDPRRIRKIREIAKVKDPNMPTVLLTKTVAEYYMYADKEMSGQNQNIISTSATSGIKIAPDSIVQATSGLLDSNGKMVLGFLHKALRALNQLRAIEDAIIIYRLSRAPERRIFYIGVGNLPKIKADQYIRDMMTKHKNKLIYDSASGEIRDDRRIMSLLEDYWIPVRADDQNTRIETLERGAANDNLEDLKYFQNRLYKSLNVPIDRLDDTAVYEIGMASQITRTEVKFAKFIDRLRLKFSSIFLKALERQLILKGLVAPDEWDVIKGQIRFRYLRDNDFAELKDQQILSMRMQSLQLLQPYVGLYYSNQWVRKNILKQDDQDIEEIDAQIQEEMKDPRYAAPMIQPLSGPMNAGGGMPMGGASPFAVGPPAGSNGVGGKASPGKGMNE